MVESTVHLSSSLLTDINEKKKPKMQEMIDFVRRICTKKRSSGK